MTTVSRTEFTIVSTDTDYQVPGDWTAAAIQRNYANDIPGIQNFQAEERIVTEGGVTKRVITFKPRSGTKG